MNKVYLIYRIDFPYANSPELHGAYATEELAEKEFDRIVRLRKNTGKYKYCNPEDYVKMEVVEVATE